VKDQVRGDISGVNEAIVSENADRITESLEKLKNSSMEIGKAIYSQNDGSSEGQSQETQQDETKEDEPKEDEKKDDEKKDEEKK